MMRPDRASRAWPTNRQSAWMYPNESGSDRRRSGDPTLFRRVLYQLSYLTRELCCDPDGTRTRDLRRDRAAR